MAFLLTIHDREGTELNEGNVVAISDGSRIKFYAEVKYLEAEQIITPFHTFSFSSMIKVDRVPDEAVLSSEERYKIWYMPSDTANKDERGEEFRKFLISWRECEHHIDRRQWRIKKLDGINTLMREATKQIELKI